MQPPDWVDKGALKTTIYHVLLEDIRIEDARIRTDMGFPRARTG